MSKTEFMRFGQRMPKPLHERLTQIAKAKGTSLNVLINEVMAGYEKFTKIEEVLATMQARIEVLEKEVFKK